MKRLFLQIECANQAHFSNSGLEMQSTEKYCRKCFLPWPVVLLAVDLLVPEGHLVAVSQGVLSPGSTHVYVPECTDLGR